MSLDESTDTPDPLCRHSSLNSATEMTKYYLSEYINDLSLSGAQANHTLGLENAFSLIPEG